MSRIKFVVLSLAAAAALSAGTASLAWAEEPAHEFMVGGKTIAEGEKVEIQETQIPGRNEIEGLVKSLSVNIPCQQAASAAGTAFLEAKGEGKSTIEFKGCTPVEVNKGVVENVPGCAVEKGKFSNILNGILSKIDYLLTPAGKEGGVVVTIGKSGKEACALEGSFDIEGTQPARISTGRGPAEAGLGARALHGRDRPARSLLHPWGLLH
jgi:hypothetical protein